MDPTYECDAPRFVDFELLKQGLDDDEDADMWFESKTNHSGLFSVKKVLSEGDDGPVQTSEAASPFVPEKKCEEEPSHKEAKPTEKIYNHFEKFKKAKLQKERTQRRRDAALKATKNISMMVKAKSRRPAAVPCPATTMPTTPNVLKRYQSKKTERPQLKSSEDREIEKILELRRERRKKVELSQKSFHRLASTKAHPSPAKSIQPPTEPVEFQFQTSARKKFKPNHPIPASSDSENDTAKFPYNLRNWDKNEWHPLEKRPATPTGKVTKVQPFHLYTDQRIKSRARRSASQEKFVSTAEFIDKFEKTTPPRFRTKIKQDSAGASQSSGAGTSYGISLDMTLPKTPLLRCRLRTRPVKVLSQAEQEERQLEDMKKYRFKAQPVNMDMFRSRDENVHVSAKEPNQPPTKAHSPHLATKDRMQLRKRNRETTEETHSFVFKAQPIPKDILGGVQGLPEKRPRELTQPSSPAITKRRRTEIAESMDEGAGESFSPIKANPVPDFSSVFQPVLLHQRTDTKPFAFEGKYPSKDEVVEKLVKEEEEKVAKMSEFTAKPLPDMSESPHLPPKFPPTRTKPEPFALMIEDRVQQHLARLNEKVAQKKEELIKMAEFKATEPTSLYSKPFEPKKSDKPLTEVININFHSDTRLQERAKFDAELKEKEVVREREMAEQRARKEAEEARELKKLRKSLVHKALPIKEFRPIEIHPSSKPTTLPLSPVLVTQTRLRGHNKQNA